MTRTAITTEAPSDLSCQTKNPKAAAHIIPVTTNDLGDFLRIAKIPASKYAARLRTRPAVYQLFSELMIPPQLPIYLLPIYQLTTLPDLPGNTCRVTNPVSRVDRFVPNMVRRGHFSSELASMISPMHAPV